MSGGPRRWREQRWLVDETIRTQTIEHRLVTPTGDLVELRPLR
jgi:hypothetical protein